MAVDPVGRAFASEVMTAIREGYPAQELLGTMLPILLHEARDAYGQDALIAQLEKMIEDWKHPAKGEH
jgi:hypothetical protein